MDWLDDAVFGADRDTYGRIVLGLKYLRIDNFRKRFLLTFESEVLVKDFLEVFEAHGPEGVLWPGLGQIVRVRAEAMGNVTLEILLLDVDPETSLQMVQDVMEKYGKVKRCAR